MKSNRSLGRLLVEALELPEEIVQLLKANRFRTVKDIHTFGVSNVALLCKIGHHGAGLIEAALSVPPKTVRLFSQRAPFKTAASFEQTVQFACSEDFLHLPVTNLKLSSRAVGVLHQLDLKTISDVLNYGLTNFALLKNIGELTSANIEHAILDLINGESLGQQTGFRRLIRSLLPSAPEKREVIKYRFGYDNGRAMSIREVAQALGTTGHRAGKIITREMRKMTLGQSGIAMYLLQQRIEVVLITNGHIAAFEDILRHPFFRRASRKHVLFMINLLCALFPQKYRIIDDHYLTSLGPSEVTRRAFNVANEYKRLLQHMSVSDVGLEEFPPSPSYILHCLQKDNDKKKLRKTENSFLFGKDRKTSTNKMNSSF